MFYANKDIIDFYNKIIETKRRIKFIRNSKNMNIRIVIDEKDLGMFAAEQLNDIGVNNVKRKKEQ